MHANIYVISADAESHVSEDALYEFVDGMEIDYIGEKLTGEDRKEGIEHLAGILPPFIHFDDGTISMDRYSTSPYEKWRQGYMEKVCQWQDAKTSKMPFLAIYYRKITSVFTEDADPTQWFQVFSKFYFKGSLFSYYEILEHLAYSDTKLYITDIFDYHC